MIQSGRSEKRNISLSFWESNNDSRFMHPVAQSRGAPNCHGTTFFYYFFTLIMERSQCKNSSVYNSEVAPEFLEDLCTPGLVITPIYRKLCVVNSNYGSTFSHLYTTVIFFVNFRFQCDFVHNNEHLTLKTRPFRFNVRAAEYVIKK